MLTSLIPFRFCPFIFNTGFRIRFVFGSVFKSFEFGTAGTRVFRLECSKLRVRRFQVRPIVSVDNFGKRKLVSVDSVTSAGEKRCVKTQPSCTRYRHGGKSRVSDAATMVGRFGSSFGHDFSFLFHPDRRRVRIVISSQKDSRRARHRIARNVFVPARSFSSFARALTIVRPSVRVFRRIVK